MKHLYEDRINDWFDQPARAHALTEGISRLIRINSVRGEARPGMPFGPGPARALAEALDMARALGFSATNYDNYVGTVDLNENPTALHILAHLDVVDGGTGWTVTEPFTPRLTEGLLYGRGAIDDKGPAVAALLAMEAVRALDIPLRQNVRLILGTDEECDSSDIAYYYAREPYAPYTFSPDGEFPLINIEKGSYKPVFSKSWAAEHATPRIRSFHGGSRINVLPPEAEAVIAGLSAQAARPFCAAAEAETGARFQLTEQGDDLHILCRGRGAHASLPEQGNNAITALLRLLCALPLARVGSTAALHALNVLFPHGDCAGKALGIAQSDEISGALTLAFSLLEVTETGLEGRFDSRTPLCATEGNCSAAAEAAFARFGFSVSGKMEPPHHTPADTPLVRTLLDCYQRYSGQAGRCLSIGGGTYVHSIPGGVAFGCEMPGFSSGMHGPDEHVRVRDLLTACKMFALAIVRLCG